MDGIPLGALIAVLCLLVLCSAFFSAAEIAMVSLNRHRLQMAASAGHRGARLAQRLLARTDRLIGVILLGSNLINALFSSLTTVVLVQVMGQEESTLFWATLIIAGVILILTDLAPKTLAALRPEQIAYPSAWVLTPLLRLMYPVVWCVNLLANGLLRLAGVSVQAHEREQVTAEELRTMVMEAGSLLPAKHHSMLLNILDLEHATVEDIMIPRQEIAGVDIDAEWPEILEAISASAYTRLPVYHGAMDNIIGILHVRDVLHLMTENRLDREALQGVLKEPYYIPVQTPLNKQLLAFQREKRRSALAVDEYGDIQGLVALEDILEEIVGEFTTDPLALSREITPQSDGSYLVDGAIHLRRLNKELHIRLPTQGPKTLNGLLLEHLEHIPGPGTSVRIAGIPLEIMQTQGNAVKMVRLDLHNTRPPAHAP
jgi:Mg2+/Co2+ transporter CorB